MVEKSNIEALKLALLFFKGNYALSFAAIAILLVLSFFSVIPLIGILFVFAYSILGFAIEIYFGKEVYNIKDEKEMEEIAANTRVGDFLTKYIAEATGAFLGLFLISLVFIFIFVLIASIFGGSFTMNEIKGMSEQEMIFYMMGAFSIPSFMLLIVGGFLLYVFPAVMGEVILSEGFNDSFRKTLLLISPSFWKKTFNKNYFILIAIWSIIIFLFAIVLVILSSTVILLPLVLIVAYLLSLYNSAIYVFAKGSLE